MPRVRCAGTIGFHHHHPAPRTTVSAAAAATSAYWRNTQVSTRVFPSRECSHEPSQGDPAGNHGFEPNDNKSGPNDRRYDDDEQHSEQERTQGGPR